MQHCSKGKGHITDLFTTFRRFHGKIDCKKHRQVFRLFSTFSFPFIYLSRFFRCHSPTFSPDSKKFATIGIRIVPMRHFASLSVNQQKTPRKIGVFFLILHFVICCNNRVQYLANKLFIRKQHTIVLCLVLHFLICYGNRLQYLANDLHCRKWHAKFWF